MIHQQQELKKKVKQVSKLKFEEESDSDSYFSSDDDQATLA